jgi:MFS family permease
MITSPFERVTAITDLVIGILVVYIALQLREHTGYKATIWRWAFGLLAVASFLGVVAHGLDMTESARDWIWKPLNLTLGLTLGLFVVGAVYDMWGGEIARKILPLMVALGFVFFGVTIMIPGTFLTFVAYEGVAMLLALAIYGFLFSRGILPGAGWMALGVIVTILAAAVQATGKPGNGIIWYFDNNGTFHLIQMVGICLLMVGLKKSL